MHPVGSKINLQFHSSRDKFNVSRLSCKLNLHIYLTNSNHHHYVVDFRNGDVKEYRYMSLVNKCLCKKTCGEELHTDDNSQQRKIEQRTTRHAINMEKQARTSKIDSNDKANQEGNRT